MQIGKHGRRGKSGNVLNTPEGPFSGDNKRFTYMQGISSLFRDQRS